MEMSLLLGLNATEWEEKLAAAAFLLDKEPAWQVFDEKSALGGQALLKALRLLPPSWAKELAYQAIQNA